MLYSYYIQIVVPCVLVALLQPLQAYPFPRGLAQYLLFNLKDRPLDAPPRLADLSHFRAFSCTNRQDGAYPDLQGACTTYYRCLGGSVYSYVCPEGTAFDREQQDCLPSALVTCPLLPPHTRLCVNQTDGFYPDYSAGCRTYYRCSSGELAGTGRCDRGALWDFATASCGAGPRASCSPPTCWGLPDGPHPVQGSRCAAYFTCNAGLRTDHVCPAGTAFDYMEKACVSSSRSVCYERVCEGRLNGVHAMPQSPCHVYFSCFNAALVQVEMCPPRHIFDGWQCVQAANFTCWTDNSASCGDRPDGVYAGDDSECRGFFLCRQKRLVRSFLCLLGLVFNGEKCVESSKYICSSRPRLPDCSNKHDGYYTLDKTNCRSFYYCRDEAKLSEHSCPGNYVFNGDQCVDPLLFSCQGRDVINNTHPVARRTRINRSVNGCSEAGDGYYLDPQDGSRCSKFFRCQEGIKASVHVCPEGFVFSGRQCVPLREFSCPVEPFSSVCAGEPDGLYHDLKSCSAYYECTAGTRVQYMCPTGTAFDGQSCSEVAKCASHPLDVCENRLDGRLMDPASACGAHLTCRAGELVSRGGCQAVAAGSRGLATKPKLRQKAIPA